MAWLQRSGPFTFVAADALVLKVREEGWPWGSTPWSRPKSTPTATASLYVTTIEDGVGWIPFFRDLVAAP